MKCGAVARHGVRRRKEMAARLHLGDRPIPQSILVRLRRCAELGQHLQHLHVRHALFVGIGDSPLHPPGGVQAHGRTREHAGPEGELGLQGRLGVHYIGGRARSGSPGQSDVARELAGPQGGLQVRRCAKSGRSRLHVDVGEKATVKERRAAARELSERDTRQRLRMLERQGAGDRDRRHGPGKTERRHDHRLAVPRKIDDALRHGAVEHAR